LLSPTITWQQRPDLWVIVTLMARTTSTTLTCDDGLQVARGVVEKPQELPRTVRLTLVPAGFGLAQTGTNLETWCPPGTNSVGPCLSTQTGRNYPAAPGTSVTVHGHQGNLEHRDGGFTLVVPGWIRLWSPNSDLTDAEIFQIADTAVVDGGW
jgi:hypothetical protein